MSKHFGAGEFAYTLNEHGEPIGIVRVVAIIEKDKPYPECTFYKKAAGGKAPADAYRVCPVTPNGGLQAPFIKHDEDLSPIRPWLESHKNIIECRRNYAPNGALLPHYKP